MVTSLFSLYIASVMNSDVAATVQSEQLAPQTVQTASVNYKKLISENAIPIKDPKHISPVINAKSSIAVDLTTGSILYEKNPHDRLPVASITKLMTSLIALEDLNLTDVVTVSHNAASVEGSQMFLREGEEITVQDLLYGTIIHSANDAATALAEHHSGSVQAFVEKMNQRALELGLINTHYSNPTGLDQKDSYSSAYDTSKLAREVYTHPFVQEAAAIKEIEVSSADGRYLHGLKSTNDLLDSYLNVKGLKTGKTSAAGLCLAGIAQNENSNEIITVVLNSPARFTETKILTDWVFRSYYWQN